MLFALAGLVAGLLHVFSGPDHLTAIAPLAVKNPRRSLFIGVQWGLGHSTGVLVIGILFIFVRDLLPLDKISSYSDRIVGVLLIGIGIWSLRKAFSKKLHTHEHAHEDHTHVHIHYHGPNEKHDAHAAHRHTHAAFGIGTLHGLGAGSSHFLGVLPAAAMPSRIAAIGYLIAFGIGTIAAMAGFSSGIGLVAKRFSTVTIYRSLMGTCAVAAISVGFYWLVFGGF